MALSSKHASISDSGIFQIIFCHLIRAAGKRPYILAPRRQYAFLSCGSVLVVFIYLFIFFLMIAGSCLSLSISNPWYSWHLPCLVQRWHSPLQRPSSLRPVWQTARCHSTQRACRWWHECYIESRVQAFMPASLE